MHDIYNVDTFSETSGYGDFVEPSSPRLCALTSVHRATENLKNLCIKSVSPKRKRDNEYFNIPEKRYKQTVSLKRRHSHTHMHMSNRKKRTILNVEHRSKKLRKEIYLNNIDVEEHLRSEFRTDFSRVLNMKRNKFELQGIFGLSPISPEADEILSLLEDVALLHYNMSRAQSQVEASVALFSYCKHRFKGNSYNMLMRIEKFCEYVLYDLCNGGFSSDLYRGARAAARPRTDYSTQSMDDFFKTSRDYLNNFDELRKAPVFAKLYKFSMYVMSLSLFDSVGLSWDNLGYTKMEQEAMKGKYHNGIDFYHTMVDTLLFLCERGYQVFKTRSAEPIFHSPKKYEEWFNKMEELKRQSTLLNDPEMFGFTESGFLADLDDTIEKGESIYKHAIRVGEYEKKAVRYAVNDLWMIRCSQMTKRKARETRETPFAVLICGNSGVGKSTVRDLMFQHYAKVKGLPSGDEFCYTRNPIAKFWDGFKTSQWGIILDDVGFMHPNKAPMGDPSCMEFIQIINPTPFVPDQADLADKGKIPMRCKFVAATTNVEDMNAHYYFATPSAAQRRFPYIIWPKPRPEFIGEGGTLDSTKVETMSGYPDYWTFTIKKVITVPIDSKSKMPKIEVIHSDVDLKTFLQWYNTAIECHDKNQSKLKSSGLALRQTEICRMCYLPTNMCDCIQSRSFNDKFVTSFLMSLIIYCLGYFLDYLRSIYYKLRLYRFSRTYKLQERKEFWINLGKNAQANIGYPKMLATCASILAASTVLYRFTKLRFGTQGSEQSKPEPEEERENVWYKDDYSLTSVDLSEKIVSMKGIDSAEFNNIISRNIFSITSDRGNGRTRPGKLICLSGQVYLGCNHTIPEFDDHIMMEIVSQTRKDGITKNITVKVSINQIERFVEKDLVIIVIPNLPPGRDITHLFAKDSFQAKCNGFYTIRERSGQITQNRVDRLIFDPSFFISDLEIKLPVWFGTSITRNTVNGDCGSPLVASSGLGHCILGLHSLGSDNKCGATQVTQEFVLEAIKSHSNYKTQGGHVRLSTASATKELGDLHRKSVFRYIPAGTCAVAGSFVGFRRRNKSSVAPTYMRKAFAKYDYKVRYFAPNMTTWQPWNKAATDACQPVTTMNNDIIDICAKSFAQDIISRLSITDKRTLMVYDIFTAVNGAAGVAYVDSINRSTSCGFPWKTSKKNHLESIPEQHGLQKPVELSSEMKHEVSLLVDRYKRGERGCVVYSATLKDEAVSKQKLLDGKVRVFTGAPLPFTIVVRQYLLSTIKLFQDNRFVCEGAPGTIAQSTEWQDIESFLTVFGRDKIVAGDYKAFDKKMPPNVILAAFSVIIEVIRDSGRFDEEDIRVIRGISYDIAFPLVDFNGDLVQFYGSNPSGHPLTVTINGIVNCIYMRYCYYQLNPLKEVQTFQRNVRLMTYGDDNVMGVSNDAPWFNHTTIASTIGKDGIVYTMPDKTSESVPYSNIRDVSFLKRSFVWDADVNATLCPLEHDSIEKMLMTWVRSRTISEQEQAIAVMSSALREYFYYGKETFNNKRKMFLAVVKELELELWVQENTFPTWEFIYKDFWRASRN